LPFLFYKKRFLFFFFYYYLLVIINKLLNLLLGMVVSGNLTQFLLKLTSHHDVIFVLQLHTLILSQELGRDTVEVVENHHGGVKETCVLVIDRFSRTTVDTARNTGKSRLASNRNVFLDALGLLRRDIRRNLTLGEVLLTKSVFGGSKCGLHTAIREETTSRVRGLEFVSLNVTRDERSKDTGGRHALADQDVDMILEFISLGLGGVERSKVGSLVESNKLVRDIEKRVELGVGASGLAFAVGENFTELTKLGDVSRRIFADVTTLDGVTARDLERLVSGELTKFRSQTDDCLVGLLEILDVLRKFFGRARAIRARSSYRSG
tara:strand:+ start:101 stop:1066 length:966 start_codon:yes stop_codon:yes gene_type:complete